MTAHRTRPPPGRAGSWFGNAYLLLGLTTLFWAGNAIAGKFAAGVLTPVTLTFFRWVLCAAIITVLAAPHLRRDLLLLRRHGWLLFALGGLGFAAFNLLLYAALNHTTAINVTIEQSGMPVLIMLINFVAFRQRIGALQAAGVAATIVGVVVTATRGEPASLLSLDINRGDAIMIGAVILYAGYTVALRYKPAVHWLSLLWALSVSALLFSAPFYAAEVWHDGFVPPSLPGWAIIVYTAVFPSVLSQLFFMRGVELIGSNRAGLFINLVPIFGALLAVVILGEAFHLYHLLALALVLGGITVAERFRPAA